MVPSGQQDPLTRREPWARDQSIETALKHVAAGISVLPIVCGGSKSPACSEWEYLQKRTPTEAEIRSLFRGRKGIASICGKVSGNLEVLDVDDPALVEPFEATIRELAPGLLERLATVATPRDNWGGRHYRYRLPTVVAGNTILARSEPRPVCNDDGTPAIDAKTGQQRLAPKTLIETRGEGGYALLPGSPPECHETNLPYKHVSGPPLTEIQTITADEHALLWRVARLFDRHVEECQVSCGMVSDRTGNSPGDDYSASVSWDDILIPAGWVKVRTSGALTFWRRPRKSKGISATTGILSSNGASLLCVFSSNAHPFEGPRGGRPCSSYSKFAAYAVLEHLGDFSAAAATLRAKGFGRSPAPNPLLSVDRASAAERSATALSDPGPLPEQLLRIPAFVSEVMDHCLATAPYPNVSLAFCGALALQAVLAGRKVRDAADNRTNIYLLALAFSSVGKDWPRKLNTHILHGVGMVGALGEKFASGEGIQDSLFSNPCMLYQTDEIDGLLQSISKSRDARFESLVGTLLTLYSTANSIYPMRRKAGPDLPGVIDQACLVLLGTAIPTHYYEALSERMLTNGLFARMLIVESGPRGVGQEPRIINPPTRVMEVAKWWAQSASELGNFDSCHPQPRIVEAEPSALALLREAQRESEAEYSCAESRGDPVGTTVWGRVSEQIRKLALLYAVSEDNSSPRISNVSVRWATEFVMRQTRRMLFMARNHVADNPFHAECLKVMRKLREAPNRQLSHSVLLKRMKIDAKTLSDLITTLVEQGDLVAETVSTEGRSQRVYRLACDTAEG